MQKHRYNKVFFFEKKKEILNNYIKYKFLYKFHTIKFIDYK